MISIQELSKTYGATLAVDSIDLEIQQGEILGLLGPNGAGKSTTLRIMTGYLPPSAGTVMVQDLDVRTEPLAVKNRIGYLPESAPLYPEMLVYDYLSYIAEIRGMERDLREKRINRLAELCGIHDVMHKTIGTLSKGYRQRVGLAHAMIGDPEILILDEPTSGLDPNQIVEIRSIIKEIGRTRTVILSTHILSEAEATCDRIVIINRGKIVADGSTEEIRASGRQGFHLKAVLADAEETALTDELKTIAGVTDIVTRALTDGSVEVLLESDEDIRSETYRRIKAADWTLLEFVMQKQSLEKIFRELTRTEEVAE